MVVLTVTLRPFGKSVELNGVSELEYGEDHAVVVAFVVVGLDIAAWALIGGNEMRGDIRTASAKKFFLWSHLEDFMCTVIPQSSLR